MASKTDCAYLAGVIDGEGFVQVKPRGLSLVLSMADTPVLDWVQAHFDGTISNPVKNRSNERPLRRWTLTRARGLVPTCWAILPYLVLKRREVEILLAAAGEGPYPGRTSALFPDWRDRRASHVERAHGALLARKASDWLVH